MVVMMMAIAVGVVAIPVTMAVLLPVVFPITMMVTTVMIGHGRGGHERRAGNHGERKRAISQGRFHTNLFFNLLLGVLLSR